MILQEFIGIAAGNLWRQKLRTGLTVIGIAIGIGALVSMLAFAFGVQANATRQFEEMGLFRTLQVLPGLPDSSRAGAAAALDAAALNRIATIPGVRFVYPQQSFDARVHWKGRAKDAVVQALPAAFAQQRSLGEMPAGRFFAGDSLPEAVVSTRWLKKLAVPADSVLGDTLRLEVASLPALGVGLAGHYLESRGMPAGAAQAVVGFVQRLLSATDSGSRTVTVVGVADVHRGFGFHLGEILVPPGVMAGVDALSFNDPLELMALLSGPPSAGWPMLVVTLEHERDAERVKAAIASSGYRIVDFLERFADMRRGFLFLDVIVAVLGFIAIFVAAMGIVNTMVMSIVERTREIGILKSLGAEPRHIRTLFLVESAAIGVVGSLGGLVLGVVVSRIASFAARQWMARQEVPPVEMFHLPVWVALAAVGFGIAVSMLAGLYPSSRAAGVDPVEALRHD